MAAFELLQKVLVNIQQSEVERVREYQRRCEVALTDILRRGAAAPVSNCAADKTQKLNESLSRLVVIGFAQE